eukprot:1195819-Prorocentrum_minimum.AAC.6
MFTFLLNPCSFDITLSSVSILSEVVSAELVEVSFPLSASRVISDTSVCTSSITFLRSRTARFRFSSGPCAYCGQRYKILIKRTPGYCCESMCTHTAPQRSDAHLQERGLNARGGYDGHLHVTVSFC